MRIEALFCDMDGVLVNQIGRKRFDLMHWKEDGRVLWEFIKPFRPVILSQLMSDIYEISKPEKLAWCERELGTAVPVIVCRAEDGKFPHARSGAVLIDDSYAHFEPWIQHGGTFIHHQSAQRTIGALMEIMNGNR